MAVRRDILIEIEASEVMLALSRGRRDPSWMAAATRAALEQARALYDPVILYEWAAVASVCAGTANVSLPGNASRQLFIGPHGQLLAEAREAMVFTASIGLRLDAAVRDLGANGELLASYLLDCVGVVALSKVGDVAARMAENRARERGWGVGPRIGPGSLEGWPVDRQKELCALLDLADADITLNGSGVLVPFKSASGLIGIGPGYPHSRVGSVCRLCTLREKCWRRKEDA